MNQKIILKAVRKTICENIYHLDLYRLSDPHEIDYLGVEDFINNKDTIALIEWPEKAGDLLQAPDIVLDMDYTEDSRNVEIKLKSNKIKLDNNLWQELQQF